MKRNPLLLLLLFAFAFSVSSCKKDDDPAPPPVVGMWELDRITESDYPAGFENYNLSYDYYIALGLSSRIDVKAAKTFDEIFKIQGIVFDRAGTWDFTNNNLNLNYTDAQVDDLTLTYDAATNRLLGEKIPQRDTINNRIVNYNIQFVYIKK